MIWRNRISVGVQVVYGLKFMKQSFVSFIHLFKKKFNRFFKMVKPGDKDLIQSLVLDANLTDIPAESCSSNTNYRE